jgi:hypothetical protein
MENGAADGASHSAALNQPEQRHLEDDSANNLDDSRHRSGPANAAEIADCSASAQQVESNGNNNHNALDQGPRDSNGQHKGAAADAHAPPHAPLSHDSDLQTAQVRRTLVGGTHSACAISPTKGGL